MTDGVCAIFFGALLSDKDIYGVEAVLLRDDDLGLEMGS